MNSHKMFAKISRKCIIKSCDMNQLYTRLQANQRKQSTIQSKYTTRNYKKNPCRVTATKNIRPECAIRHIFFTEIFAGLVQTAVLTQKYDQIALQRCPLSRTIRKPPAKCHTKTQLHHAYIITIQSNETRRG